MLKQYILRDLRVWSLISLFVVIAYTVTNVVIGTTLYAIPTGYGTEDFGLTPGMAVSLSQSSTSDSPKVERTTTENNEQVIGVAVSPLDELVASGRNSSSVFVRTSGEVEAFVSDINGDVVSGDLLAPSPLGGILMKADENAAPVVGIALADFSSVTAVTRVIEEDGQSQEVSIARLLINLDHKAESNQHANMSDSSLERLGRAIVGKPVSEIQVVAALAIFFVVLVAEGGIIYGAISSSITAVGRNPLAGKIIRSELTRVIGIALVVLMLGTAAIYAILWV